MSMNKFIGIGRWSKDIDLRYTASGKPVASSTIAINDKYGGQDNTTFLGVVMWGKTAENVAQHSSKGRLIALEGRIQVRNYDNNEGKKIYITEIVAENVKFLDSNRDGSQRADRVDTSRDPFQDDGRPMDISEDDLPF